MQNKKQKLIESTGFSDKKARIYLALLEAGEVTVGDLAKRCDLKRTTIYNILPELKQDGYIKSTLHNKKHYFYVDSVKALERIAKEKIEGIKQLIPLLETSQNILSVKPKITLYEGVSGMNQLYQEVIDTVDPGDKILTYLGSQDFEKFISEDVLEKYVGQRIEKKVLNRVITGPGSFSKDWEGSSTSQLREMKIAKNQTEVFSGDMKIFKNKIALLSYKENFFGVVIESTQISTLCRSMFNLLWEAL